MQSPPEEAEKEEGWSGQGEAETGGEVLLEQRGGPRAPHSGSTGASGPTLTTAFPFSECAVIPMMDGNSIRQIEICDCTG